jgi:K+-transporting ATPase ATPase C chain
MSFAKETSRAIRSTLITWVIVALIYPLVMIAFGQIVFPVQANGSLIQNPAGQVIGSTLIGQPFTSDRYFHSRPSTVSYSTQKEVLKTGISGASNLAPSNVDLLNRIRSEAKSANVKPTADSVYTSGSGLDPHITHEAAQQQILRVAKVRGLQLPQLEALIEENTDRRFLGIFGEPGVNVLKLNLALDQIRE